MQPVTLLFPQLNTEAMRPEDILGRVFQGSRSIQDALGNLIEVQDGSIRVEVMYPRDRIIPKDTRMVVDDQQYSIVGVAPGPGAVFSTIFCEVEGSVAPVSGRGDGLILYPFIDGTHRAIIYPPDDRIIYPFGS